MDKQIALMKKLQKDPDTIAYAHCDEIILIKREAAEDGSAVLVEITINIDTEKATSKRSILDSEMQLSDFDAMKKLLTDRTTEEFNADWRITHRDVDLDKLENTDILCLPSVEEEYIEKFEGEEDYRTMENAMNLLDELLNEKQKKWFLMSYRDGLSDREISRREGVAQTTVSRGLTVIEKKIKNFSEKAQKYASKSPKKL
ncbi:MAG: sigma-70 family RNA polymerase sigma factor [Clostridia bacterium]|nr:sigma-70 family RNA polymerase sigma factor [Clostridia bacterium]